MAVFQRNINIRLVARNPADAGRFVVGDTVAWAGGVWAADAVTGINTITLNNPGYELAGFIQFVRGPEAPEGLQPFTVAVGLHGGRPWSDIVTGYGGLTLEQISRWYRGNADRDVLRDLHVTDRNVIHDGTPIRVQYTQIYDNNRDVNVTFG